MKWLAIVFSIVLLCSPVLAQTKPQPTDVSTRVESLTGHKLQPATKSTVPTMPDGISLDDGVTEDEAVAIALWNNPTLQAEMMAIGVARADVIQAGLLSNPQLTMIFPFSFRILEAVANWPIEAIWQRPRRVAAAKAEQERISETLVSRALDLVRDVRLAYADYSAARSRAVIADEVSLERAEIAVITNARLRAGDISELETSAAVTDARLAEERSARLSQDVELTKERLRTLLGFGADSTDLNLIVPQHTLVPAVDRIIAVHASAPTLPPIQPTTEAVVESKSLNDLIEQALAARPEIKAGELAIASAGARAKWERSRIMNVTVIAKEYGRGTNGWEQGPGVTIDLPIFNRNQGNISRAEAEIERAARQLIAARQRVISEVREAYVQLTQARSGHELWRTRVLPPLIEDIRLAHTSYRSGDVAYLFVLETGRRYSDERLREADFQAATKRSMAQLERSIGRRLIANR